MLKIIGKCREGCIEDLETLSNLVDKNMIPRDHESSMDLLELARLHITKSRAPKGDYSPLAIQRGKIVTNRYLAQATGLRL